MQEEENLQLRVQLLTQSSKSKGYTKPFVIVLVFYLFSSLCSDAGQDVGSEESNCKDHQDKGDNEVNERNQDLTKLEGDTSHCH